MLDSERGDLPKLMDAIRAELSARDPSARGPAARGMFAAGEDAHPLPGPYRVGMLSARWPGRWLLTLLRAIARRVPASWVSARARQRIATSRLVSSLVRSPADAGLRDELLAMQATSLGLVRERLDAVGEQQAEILRALARLEERIVALERTAGRGAGKVGAAPVPSP